MRRRRWHKPKFPEATLRYGLMDSETTPEVHVMPLLASGLPCTPHIPDPRCPCHPWKDDFQPLLFIHDPVM